MAGSETQELVARFEEFYRSYYHDEIGELAQQYPNERRSLYIDWVDLYRFDQDLADDYRNQPEQLERHAREALRLYDLPVDVSLGQAHVRIRNLPSTTDIREIRAHHVNTLVSARGIIRKATDVRPKIQVAAFECQRCGTLSRIPQEGGKFQEPHECQGCERQGPYRINFDQSQFVDAQKLRIQESPEGLRGGETPQTLDVHIEDDITGAVTPGDHVVATGTLRLEQQRSNQEKSTMFDVHMEGSSIEVEEEQFEDMEITDEDKQAIVELSTREDIYEQMVDSIAPTIYGHDSAKLAMALQLFSGVTKHLPDGSRTRGDLHMLLIGDPGTGKSQLLQYIRNIAPRSVYTSGKGSSSAGLCVTGDTLIHTKNGFRRIRELARQHHPEPVSEDTSAPLKTGLYTYDQTAGRVECQRSSHVWRMPEKPCRRIETGRGKRLEASINTPVLVCGERGTEWKPLAEIDAGEHVAVPKYADVDRSSPPIQDYVEFKNEKLKLADDSIAFVRQRLRERYGTLRTAAAELGFTEDFIYDSLSNRFVPIERLDRILDAIGADRTDVTIERAMLRHGHEVTLPDAFTADLMYLVGLVFGDGDISLSRRGANRGLVRISNSDESILEHAIEIIDRTFGKRVEIERQTGRVPSIRLNSATVARFFANVGMQTPKSRLELDPRLTASEHADAFLRGLMDADGSVSARVDGGSSVHFSTISRRLASQVQLMLETYGVYARARDRDRRGTYTLESRQHIETKHVQTHLEMYGRNIDAFAERIGFGCAAKRRALDSIVGETERRDENLPIGNLLQTIDAPGGSYYMNLVRGDNPGRERARAILESVAVGPARAAIAELVEADLVWDEVVEVIDTGTKEVYDLTVPGTHNFVGNGIVTHNTAAAVRDDFGDGQQWTLEAGALVLADRGIAAVDELDKMRPEDRSAMHEALEQQSISISKAGINATLKSRCSLLGAANPKHGRFDRYESFGEQIDLEPALISRFDLIFTVTDQPNEETDRELAHHILQTNYAGELHTQRTKLNAPDVTQEEVDAVSMDVSPAIEAELLRKYVAYAQQTCYPRLTSESREAIQEFYVNLRSRGADDDAPVPVTARKLEALVRLSEASARIRLSDTIELEDAERVIEIVRTCLQEIGVDPETGQYDADVIETGRSKTQRDRVKGIKQLIRELQDEYDEGAPIDEVLEEAERLGIDRSKAEHEIQKLRDQGEVYSPSKDHLRVV